MPVIKPREITGETLVSQPQELLKLSPLPFLHDQRRGRIQLGGAMAEHAERERWEQALNQHYYACGCGEGAIGMIAGLVLSGLWMLFSFLLALWAHDNVIVTFVLVTTIAALLGKTYGLMSAHIRLKRLAREIGAAIQTSPEPG